MFIHIFDKETMEKLEDRGCLILQRERIPYIGLIEGDMQVSFDDIKDTQYEFTTVMYF